VSAVVAVYSTVLTRCVLSNTSFLTSLQSVWRGVLLRKKAAKAGGTRAKEVARARAKVRKAMRMPVDPSRTVAGLTMRAIQELLHHHHRVGARQRPQDPG